MEGKAALPSDGVRSPGSVDLLTTRSSRILEADDFTARLLGCPVQDLVHKPLAALVDREARARFRSRLARLPDDGLIHDWRLRLCPPNGKGVDVVATVAPERTDGPEGRLRWTLVMEPSLAGADPQASRHGAAHLTLERELGQLAHDLNQPLAAILTFVRGAQLRLRSGTLSDADLETALETIAQEALRANAIARDLGNRWRIS